MENFQLACKDVAHLSEAPLVGVCMLAHSSPVALLGQVLN